MTNCLRLCFLFSFIWSFILPSADEVFCCDCFNDFMRKIITNIKKGEPSTKCSRRRWQMASEERKWEKNIVIFNFEWAREKRARKKSCLANKVFYSEIFQSLRCKDSRFILLHRFCFCVLLLSSHSVFTSIPFCVCAWSCSHIFFLVRLHRHLRHHCVLFFFTLSISFTRLGHSCRTLSRDESERMRLMLAFYCALNVRWSKRIPFFFPSSSTCRFSLFALFASTLAERRFRVRSFYS